MSCLTPITALRVKCCIDSMTTTAYSELTAVPTPTWSPALGIPEGKCGSWDLTNGVGSRQREEGLQHHAGERSQHRWGFTWVEREKLRPRQKRQDQASWHAQDLKLLSHMEGEAVKSCDAGLCLHICILENHLQLCADRRWIGKSELWVLGSSKL